MTVEQGVPRPDGGIMRPQRLANRITRNPHLAFPEARAHLGSFAQVGGDWRVATVEGSEGRKIIAGLQVMSDWEIQLVLSVGKGSARRFMDQCGQDGASGRLIGELVPGTQELSITLLYQDRRLHISAQAGEHRAPTRVNPEVFAALYTSLSSLPADMRGEARKIFGAHREEMRRRKSEEKADRALGERREDRKRRTQPKPFRRQ